MDPPALLDRFLNYFFAAIRSTKRKLARVVTSTEPSPLEA
jgi:hypothetical protein